MHPTPCAPANARASAVRHPQIGSLLARNHGAPGPRHLNTSPAVPKSDLPFGSEFSPAQIHLPTLLELAHRHGPNWRGFEDAVRDRYFAANPTSAYNRNKLANNTKLSMRAYGLIEPKDTTLTQLGRALYGLRHDAAALHEAFARHILKNRQGMTFVQCLLDMQTAGDKVDLTTLRRTLGERGITVPRGGKHMSTLRRWLEEAGIFVSGYRIDRNRLREVLQVGVEDFETLAALSREQRAYLKALTNIADRGPHSSNDIEKLATATYGVTFNEKNLPQQVLYPLRDAGYIDLTRGTKAPGRGAKPFRITATDKLAVEVIAPLLEQLDQQVQTDLQPLLRKPLRDIRKELDSQDRHVRGLALEALAIRLMRLIDLTYVATRLRGAATGGAEVDVIFESARLVFSRWQIQCKNTGRVSLDDVAKEVGLTHLLNSNAVVMVSTGRISDDARRYANTIMAGSNLCIIMVDGDDLDHIETRPTAIVDVFTREARHAMDLKKLDLPGNQP